MFRAYVPFDSGLVSSPRPLRRSFPTWLESEKYARTVVARYWSLILASARTTVLLTPSPNSKTMESPGA